MYTKIFARMMLALTLSGGALIAGAGGAAAAAPVDMHVACQVTYGQVGWRATLAYPNLGGWGWRCYLVGGGGALKGVDIEKYCQTIYGLHARGGSTAYNWRCDY
ncbi:hypothetical protein [Nocardia brasiliensis]|uniref:hypothetical protein n=1 Tax=Nocardia brasiliensis TaxID=37326 RepID=UPI003D8BD7E8